MRKINKILKIFLYLVIGVITIAPIASSIYNRLGNCEIKGEIEGLGTQLAIVTGGSQANNDTYKKYILVINDKFSFHANYNKLGEGKILTRDMLFKRANGSKFCMASKTISYYIKENEKIAIKGHIDKYSVNYSITGNTLSEHQSKFKQATLPYLVKETKIQIQLDSLNNIGAKCNTIDSLYNEYDKLRYRYNNKRLQYIRNNPTHIFSAHLLRCQHKDTIAKYLPSLSLEVLASLPGKEAKEMILTN